MHLVIGMPLMTDREVEVKGGLECGVGEKEPKKRHYY